MTDYQELYLTELRNSFASGMADAAYAATKQEWWKNRDPALEFGDFVNMVLIELNRECGGVSRDPPLMYRMALYDARDIIKAHKREAHLSLNESIEDGEGNTVTRLELLWAPGVADVDVSIAKNEEACRHFGERYIPEPIRRIVAKRIRGIPTSASERKRLSRFRQSPYFAHLRDRFRNLLNEHQRPTAHLEHAILR